MLDTDLIYETDRGRARITLNRPERHNAISQAMHRGLHEALWRADADPEVHAIVIRGAGPSFCAGFDLTGYTNRPKEERPGSPRGRSRACKGISQEKKGRRSVKNRIFGRPARRPKIPQNGHVR